MFLWVPLLYRREYLIADFKLIDKILCQTIRHRHIEMNPYFRMSNSVIHSESTRTIPLRVYLVL